MNPTNLYEFYNSKGQTLPSVQDRAPLYAKAGGTGTYTGTAQQDTQLLSYLKNQPASTNPQSNITDQSTTTLSSDKSKDIATNNARLGNMDNRGITTDTNTGVSTYSNGSVYTPPVNYPTDGTFLGQLTRDTNQIKSVVTNPDGTRLVYFRDGSQQAISRDPNAVDTNTASDDSEIQSIFDQIKTESDANTASAIASIQSKYAALKAQQRQVNQSKESATQGALFRSGAAEHDVYAQRAMQEEVQRSANAIADLDREEQDLINQAKAAQSQNNQRLLEKKLTLAEQKRSEKMDAAQKLNEQLLEAEKAARDAKIKASRDSAIAGLYSQGVTDVSQMLDYLNFNDQGDQTGDFTAEEISKALKDIVPAGLDDLVKTLRTNGAPENIIKQVLSSGNMSDAYKAAGAYASGGTGIVGEYNFYRAQALSMGQVPVDFQTYQDIDANRKKSIARAGAAGMGDLSSKEASTYLSITNKYQADPIINAAIKAGQITALANQIIANPESTTNQLASLYIFVKNLDPESAVREGELALANATQSYLQKYSNEFVKLGKGRVLSPAAAKDLAAATKNLVKTWQDTAERKTQLYKSQANHASPNVGTAFGDYIGEYNDAVGNNGSGIINDENEATTAVKDFYKTTGEATQNAIDALVTQGKTYVDIYAYLKDKGYIQ